MMAKLTIKFQVVINNVTSGYLICDVDFLPINYEKINDMSYEYTHNVCAQLDIETIKHRQQINEQKRLNFERCYAGLY
jgi:hypothetical protein